MLTWDFAMVTVKAPIHPPIKKADRFNPSALSCWIEAT
ncbi:hypothetical protein EHW99_1529 [Erwinia amylovora]|nr:hypothetical protein EHX00_1529 [Erwinia amylovora]QJQ57931.1 hypothetical protein EHW99_1529 [Erwinia amylovora]QJQ61630.1 hypothetical protein EHW98_1529 [Erwinia amylovora]QJQ65432.1 hypothetical protein EHW96_1529 [Erwinia amylovora]QJQ69131.1 hypothetical protein EGZ89_1529 [Erwinia amylovora]